MSIELQPRPELPEVLEQAYAVLDTEITMLTKQLEDKGFVKHVRDTHAHTYILEVSDTYSIKVIIYSVGGHFLGRAGTCVQEVENGWVKTQAKFDTFGLDYANICKQVMGLVNVITPES